MSRPSKPCIVPDCGKRASFSYNAQPAQPAQPMYCRTHKSVGMRDVRHRSCTHCYRRPSFGQPGTRHATHCFLHRTPGLINVKHGLCQHPGCDTYASFGTVQNRPVRCHVHKISGMRNVKATQCQYPGCVQLKPKYGNHILGRILCHHHFDRSQHWRLSTCKETGCWDIATHSLEGQLPFEFCHGHAPATYKSYLERVCSLCNLVSLCDPEGHCLLSCSRNVSHMGKQSEHALHQFFTRHGLEFVYDQRPGTGCSKRRPDFLFSTLYGVLIVENDEHRHSQYEPDCELSRMQELWTALGEAVHFIRFNPDVTALNHDCLASRHEALLQVIRPILEDPATFFSAHPGLSFQYMFYE